MTMQDRFYRIEYVDGQEVRHWLEYDEFMRELDARRISLPTVSESEILALIGVESSATLRYIQRLYEVEFVRRFQPYETTFLLTQFRGGMKPIYHDSPAYLFMRKDCPTQLPVYPRRKHPNASYSRVFDIDGHHPLNYIYVAFAKTPHHLYCLPARITMLDFALLLSALTPVGRQCVCDFYNKRGKIPAVLYWTWVQGAKADKEMFFTHHIHGGVFNHLRNNFAANTHMCLSSIRDVRCRAECGDNITLLAKYELDNFSDGFEWIFPNLLHTGKQVFVDPKWLPTGPTLKPGNITQFGMLGPDYTSLVCYKGRYYYQVSRGGVVREIPLTRYPSHADLRSAELQRAVDQAFMPTANVAERTVEGGSPLSNPALSGASSARE